MNIKAITRTVILTALLSAILDMVSIRYENVSSLGQSHQLLQKTGKISPPAATAVPPERVSMLFTGDITLGRCVAKAATRAGDFTYPFQYVAERLRSADITIGSLDGTISDESPPMPCPDSINLIGPETMVEGLQFAGFDVITVATNHIKDCGEKGYRCGDLAFLDTIDNLSKAGIRSVGGGSNLNESRQPVVIEVRGVRFAFLGINQIDERVWATERTAGTAPLSSRMTGQIKRDIAAAREIADVVIVLPQWGIEYAPEPEENQRVWAQEFLDAGASLVIGNHPHIVQPVEEFHNGLVFYSLGNFVFDQEHDFRREGMVIQAVFSGSQIESWKILPVYIDYFTYQPRWVDGTTAKKILDRAIPLPP